MCPKTVAGGGDSRSGSSSEKRFKLADQLLRNLLRQEMAGGKRLAARLDRAIPPCLQDVVHPVERAFLGPQHEKRALYFLVQVGCVVGQIDGCSGAIILADRADRGWITEAAKVVVVSSLANPLRNIVPRLFAAQTKQHRFEKKLGAIFEHCFREWRRLNEQEPMEKNGGELLVHVLIALVGGHNIQDDKPGEAVRMIESETMGNASSAIVANEGKLAISQMLHDFDLS